MSGTNGERRRAAWITGVVLLLIVASAAFVDRPLSTWSHVALHRPAWCVWLTWIADLPAPLAVATLAGLGIAWLIGWRPGPLARLALAVCLATLAADTAKDVLKLAFGRPWPETWVNHNPSWIGTGTYGFFPFHGGPGWASFPSGHTTSITAPCAALWRRLPRLRPLWIMLPVVVAIGLIGADFHFLSDCIAGAALGVAVTQAVR